MLHTSALAAIQNPVAGYSNIDETLDFVLKLFFNELT